MDWAEASSILYFCMCNQKKQSPDTNYNNFSLFIAFGIFQNLFDVQYGAPLKQCSNRVRGTYVGDMTRQKTIREIAWWKFSVFLSLPERSSD